MLLRELSEKNGEYWHIPRTEKTQLYFLTILNKKQCKL